jgi:hypothetical protein
LRKSSKNHIGWFIDFRNFFDQNMAAVPVKIQPRATFQPVHLIESIFTGGKVAVTEDAQLLITAAGEDIFVTHLVTGKTVFKLTGVRVLSRDQV